MINHSYYCEGRSAWCDIWIDLVYLFHIT